MQTPEKDKYIFDTSVLIAFSNLQKLNLLCQLYSKILIPETVKNEFDEELPGCCEIIKVDYSSVESLKTQRNIGSGEASVIIYSLSLGDKITCFIDEQKARKIAKERHLKVSGTIGILMRMEEKNLISSAYEETLVLKEKGFHISDKILEDLFA